MGRNPIGVLLEFANYSNATNAWSDVLVEIPARPNIFRRAVTFSRLNSDVGVDVIIAGYWDPNPGNGGDLPCGESIACTHPAGDYPHIGGAQPFWIEDPPHWGGRKVSETWTTDFIEAKNDPLTYEYLPSVLMHEFGHTFGMGHGVPGDIMHNTLREVPPCSSRTGSDQCGLSDNDINGAKAVYQGRTAH